MSDIKEEIISGLKSAIKDFSLPGEALEAKDIVLQTPKEESHGDYSSNVALILSKVLKRNPLELAEEIVKKINSSDVKLANIAKVEAVKPGFINFWLSKEYLIENLSKLQDLDKPLKNKKIMVEFTDPNPFKEFHIGHLYSNIVGESISRLLEALGANVKRANYQGDVGMHVAKALWGIFHLCHAELARLAAKRVSASQILENKILKQVQDDSLNEKAKFLGEAYALGAKAYEEDENAKKEIEQLNKKIYDKEPAITGLYEKGRQWSLEYFEEIYKRLGTQFDFYYFESEVGIEGLELVKEYLKKGVFEESQGAVIFPGEKYGLHNRVFITSLGLPTYEAKELGLVLKKYKDFQYDQSIIITGNEIIGYFKVLIAALRKINPDLAAKTKHLPHGMVKLPTGKMSSRSGNIITGEWLLDEARKLLKSKYSEMTDDALEKVAVGSVKYALLKSSIGHDIEFSFEDSISLEGNSGPYLQYTFARTQSVIAKVKSQKSKVKTESQNSKVENEELLLLRSLNRFEEVIQEAGEKFAPNLLCNYLFDLAQKFNLFYQKCKIIGSENEDFRLVLTKSVGQVLKNGLGLLGIAAPEKM